MCVLTTSPVEFMRKI